MEQPPLPGSNGSPPDVTSESEAATAQKQSSSSASWRQLLGQQMHRVSDTVNDNLIIARYATFASLTLLTAYGISQTPLFFRYHTVNDIPTSMFTKRRTIQCRLIRVALVSGGDRTRSIRLYARHVSPIGRIMSRSAYDTSLKIMQPSPDDMSETKATTARRTENTNDPPSPLDALQLELAGVERPPTAVNKIYLTDLEWLRQLANNETMVRCQLLGRRSSSDAVVFDPLVPDDQQAVVRITLRQPSNSGDPTTARRWRWRLFGIYNDVAGMLLQQGEVRVSSSGLFVNDDVEGQNDNDKGDGASSATATIIKDCSTKVKDLRNDVAYMETLAVDEAKAARARRGLWADPGIQQKEEDLLDEVDFQQKATLLQKLWRRIRYGG